jgi:glycosyltransferase involved in cell wall biosynthesis
VGKEDERLNVYTSSVRARVAHLELDDAVVFTGEVTDSALKAFYLLADVFMITSEHEGFCVPLVEAMAMKCPIVALGSSAVPGTVAASGLVWEQADPELLAESVHCIMSDEPTRAALSTMGWRRYEQQFTNERIEREFLTAMDGLL